VILNIDTGITGPLSLENTMAATTLTRFPEVEFTQFSQFNESNPIRILIHFLEYFGQITHIK